MPKKKTKIECSAKRIKRTYYIEITLLQRIEKGLGTNLNLHWNVHISQVNEDYSILYICLDSKNEIDLINNSGRLSLRICGFESDDPKAIKDLKHIIESYQFYARRRFIKEAQ